MEDLRFIGKCRLSFEKCRTTDGAIKQTNYLQNLADRHDNCLYKELKAVFGPSTSAAAPLRSEDGSVLLTDRASIMQIWNEYVKDLLNRPSNVSMESLAKVHQEQI